MTLEDAEAAVQAAEKAAAKALKALRKARAVQAAKWRVWSDADMALEAAGYVRDNARVAAYNAAAARKEPTK